MSIEPVFRLPPYKHQQREWDKHRDSKSRALLWTMRTGKTKATIDLACYWREEYGIDGVLIFAPNGVHENWVRRELIKHHWNRVPFNAIGFGTEKSRTGIWQRRFERALESDDLMWLAVNSESMIRPDATAAVKRFIKKKKHFLLLVDESHDFRIPGSKRTKRIRSIAPHAAGVRIMSGTSVLNSPLHAFSQFEILKKGALGYTQYQPFKKRYAIEEYRSRKGGDGKELYGGRKFPTITGYKNLEELSKRIRKRSTIINREDVKDLPDLIKDVRYVGMSNEQLRIYRQLHKQFSVEVQGEEVSIGENTMRMIKLQQALSGFLIDEFGEVHRIPGVIPRQEALITELLLSPGKTIIWGQFREDLKMIKERLELENIGFVEYSGRVKNDAERQRAIDLFNHDADTEVFLGQPGAGGSGLDLSSASNVFWYSHTFNAIIRSQADERATAIGGKNVMMIDFVVPDSIDSYILDSTEEKRDISAQLTGSQMSSILQETKL